MELNKLQLILKTKNKNKNKISLLLFSQFCFCNFVSDFFCERKSSPLHGDLLAQADYKWLTTYQEPVVQTPVSRHYYGPRSFRLYNTTQADATAREGRGVAHVQGQNSGIRTIGPATTTQKTKF